MYSGCIFVDFSKAFETVDHNILLNELKLYGFAEKSLKLLHNYVSTRTQVTTVNDYTSEAKSVRCGTTQGSILGPLIYIIYVNDVLGILGDDVGLYLYADDMLITACHANVECMMNNLQNSMNTIYEWCRKNRLTINESKTKYMVISNVNVEPIARISIAGNNLCRVKQYEYLGMIIQDKLNMDVQIESMYKKANK